MAPFLCVSLCVALTPGWAAGGAPAVWGVALTFVDPPPRVLLVGETVKGMVVELRLTNRSTATQVHVPLEDACRAGMLEIDVTPNSCVRRHMLEPIMYGWPKVLPTMAPGGHAAARFPLGTFGLNRLTATATLPLIATAPKPLATVEFDRLKTAGRIQLVGRYETGKGIVEARPLELNVRDVPEPPAGAKKVVLPRGREAERLPAEQGSVDIRRVPIGTETWLVCVSRVAPCYGGGIDETTRLVRVEADTEFLVSGQFGEGEPIQIAYFTPAGVLKVLSLHPIYLTLIKAK